MGCTYPWRDGDDTLFVELARVARLRALYVVNDAELAAEAARAESISAPRSRVSS